MVAPKMTATTTMSSMSLMACPSRRADPDDQRVQLVGEPLRVVQVVPLAVLGLGHAAGDHIERLQGAIDAPDGLDVLRFHAAPPLALVGNAPLVSASKSSGYGICSAPSRCATTHAYCTSPCIASGKCTSRASERRPLRSPCGSRAVHARCAHDPEEMPRPGHRRGGQQHRPGRTPWAWRRARSPTGAAAAASRPPGCPRSRGSPACRRTGCARICSSTRAFTPNASAADDLARRRALAMDRVSSSSTAGDDDDRGD